MISFFMGNGHILIAWVQLGKEIRCRTASSGMRFESWDGRRDRFRLKAKLIPWKPGQSRSLPRKVIQGHGHVVLQ